MAHPILAAAELALNIKLETRGDLALLDRARHCLLVSRTEHSPLPGAAWVQRARAATQALISAGEVLVSGTGRIPYDLALLECRRANAPAIIALEGEPATAAPDPHLFPEKHLLVWSATLSLSTTGTLRDLIIGHLADRATAIMVRPGGNMADVREILQKHGGKITDASVPAGSTRSRRITVVPEEFRTLAGEWTCLTHFTREPDGQWPDEEYAAYINWLAGDPVPPARSAFTALCRILEMQRILACGRLMPEGWPMVCFSAARPDELLRQRRWRKGLRRWSFTPYGVAIKQDILRTIGAAPVQYCSAEDLKRAAPSERAFMQVASTEAGEWRAEAEWRVSGDVDLRQLPRQSLRALVVSEEEAALIRATFGIDALALGEQR